jgi:hypothetical protein
VGQQGRPQELLKGIDDPVQELQHEERLDLGRRGHEKEEVCVSKAEDEGRRVCVGEIDEVRPWYRVFEVEG